MYINYSFFRWREDYSSQNMIVVFIGMIMVIVVIIYIWKCCKCDEDKPGAEVSPQQQQVPLVPCYAHELEPGLVVLQSPDGEYFRILQEYDATKHPRMPLPNSSQPLQYVPQFTRPHFQQAQPQIGRAHV